MSDRSIVAAHALHARPASNVVAAASRFDADVTLVAGDRDANAKSVISVLALNVPRGGEVLVRAAGPDADAALDAIVTVIAGG